MQVIGETVVTTGVDEEAQAYFTPWFPRVADNAVFSYERIHSSLSTNETVTVFHKDAEESGDEGSSVTTFSSQIGTTGIFQATCSGLKEMVRFRVTTTSTASPEMLHYRFLPPTWYDDAV